jgi:hypothetical protein
MRLIDDYAGNDEASMNDNNSSAFNCRGVTGQSGTWSQHAYGHAVDLNPVQNPFITESSVLPEAGAAYLDRSLYAKGMIHDGDPVVRAFESIGWKWGGHWKSHRDYQHFSLNGR